MSIQKKPKKQTASWECLGKKSFGFVPHMIRFIRPACYASFVNTANFINIGKQNVHRFLGFLLFA